MLNCSNSVILFFLVSSLITAGAGEQPHPTIESDAEVWPGFKTLRYDEDWSGYHRNDWYGSLKQSTFADDAISISFGGHVRGRFESHNQFAFGAPREDNDSFYLHRAQVHGDLMLGDHVRVFAEFINASSTTRDLPGKTRKVDVDEADILNAFVELSAEVGPTDVALRVGRQQFSFGKQRLVSGLPWANTWNKWDAVSLISTWEDWQLSTFYSWVVDVDPFELNQHDDRNEFFGAYLTKGPHLDLYYLGHKMRGEGFTEERHTLGGRVSREMRSRGLDVDLEAAYQFGEVDDRDVDAWMVAAELGYRPSGWAGTPRFWLGFDYASGDSDPNDNQTETFDQFFPLAHAYLGYLDLIGRQNVIALNAGVTFKPSDPLTLRLAGPFFWRADKDDAVYSPNRSPLRSGDLGDDREIGAEVDVSANYQFNQHLKASVGYTHFFAGDFIEESGASEDIDFIYTGFQFTF